MQLVRAEYIFLGSFLDHAYIIRVINGDSQGNEQNTGEVQDWDWDWDRDGIDTGS